MSNDFVKSEKVLNRLNWRYAVKKFDPTRRVSDKDLETLEESIMVAPTSFGLQLFKAIVIINDETRQKLRPAAWGQSQITESSHLIVFAAKKTIAPEDIEQFFERIVEVRGTPLETLAEYKAMVSGFGEKAVAEDWAFSWCQRQTYLALGFLLQTAALIGVDACPMEGFDPAQFNEILGLRDYSATALCALGYRSEADWLADLPKVRMPKEEIIVRI
jgi:nitroreductase